MSSPSNSSSRLTRTLFSTGTAALGAYAGLSAARWWHRRTLPPSTSLSPALEWEARTLETRYGRSYSYVRPGTGTPIVLLHSFNAAASSYEMKPIAEHLAATTERPLYALDWLGFGRSDRLALDYKPQVYAHQLYQMLAEGVDGPADLVGLSLGSEYAAWVALQAAPQVKRLVLVSPTGLTTSRGPSKLGGIGLSIAAGTGLFELLFYRLTRRASLREYYERQVFADPDAVPEDLVAYAGRTTHVKGAHHAPRRFVEGTLFLDDVAEEIYNRLYRPTLLLTPSSPGPTVQSFDLLPLVLDRNPRDLTHRTLPGGLMPHWEAPDPFFDTLTSFLTRD